MNNTIGPRGEKTIEFVRILKQSFPGIELKCGMKGLLPALLKNSS